MAEIQNTFIKSKMNKDLDDRLVPTGEYRNAQNISISRSEGSDVGALENILGNSQIDVTNLGIANLDVIGFLADNATNYIYLFLTDYTDSSALNNVFAPVDAKCFIYRYNPSTANTPPTKLAEGRFLNFSKSSPIIGVNLLEDLLFWTDNRNQPRKINVQSAANSTGYYMSEDTISVAKPLPINPIKLVNLAENQPLVSTMVNPSQQYLPGYPPAPPSPENPDYLSNWAGDPNYLKDRLIRFSYRYKFDDGEYSLIAPFTQICFIPKQQGYFLDGDQEEAYRSTVVQFFENNVTEIGLNIQLPYEDMGVAQHVTDIEILCKESDSTIIKAVESIPISIVNSVVTYNKAFTVENIYNFTYISSKPYKTLPSDQTTRVYDMVPVRALAQEVAGNRVMYGNFVDKNTPPESINYGVGYYSKEFNFSEPNKIYSSIEYPNHTLKQNRNYQVGIVLCDKFGRQSSVILSSKDDESLGQTVGLVAYGGSTIFVPYYKSAPSTILHWPGYALRVVFDSPGIISDVNTQGEPGLYSETNPLGWYSYKIVVKQTEQDYYNVYLPGILNGYPTGTIDQNSIANIVLINDNINKVPRDLSEVGPDQRQYRSSVQLFGRVNPTVALNNQYYPGTNSDTVVSISTVADTNYNVSQGASLVYPEFYQSETNPLIGRINTSKAIGVTNSNFNLTLGVYETSPVESLLDIYWETSSVGLISDLNALIAEGTSAPAAIDLNAGYSQNEGMNIGATVVSAASILDAQGQPVAGAAFTLAKVENSISGNPTNITSRFSLVDNGTGTFDIKTNDFFYYGVGDPALINFVFYVNCIVGTETTQLSFLGNFSNISPTYSFPCGSNLIYGGNAGNNYYVATALGENGLNINALYANRIQGLVWSIGSVILDGLDVTSQGIFSIDPNTGIITNPNNVHTNNKEYAVNVSLADDGGAVAPSTCAFNVTFGAVAMAPRSVTTSSLVYSPSWLAIWSDGNTQTIYQDTIVTSNGAIPVSNAVSLTLQTFGGGILSSNHKYEFTDPNGNVNTIIKAAGESSVVTHTFTGIIDSADLCEANVIGNFCQNYRITPIGMSTIQWTNCDGSSGFVLTATEFYQCSTTTPTGANSVIVAGVCF
jgi:hypothetical protein